MSLSLTLIGHDSRGNPVIGWTPVLGAAGYRFQSAAMGGRWSHTWDASRTNVTFLKGTEPFRVQTLLPGPEGVFQAAAAMPYPIGDKTDG